MKRELLVSKEKKCPKCGSTEVDATGLSHQVQGYVKMIGFKCLKPECKADFWISETDYKY
jgi:hypothetical protein